MEVEVVERTTTKHPGCVDRNLNVWAGVNQQKALPSLHGRLFKYVKERPLRANNS
jgi:hypothetical protein